MKKGSDLVLFLKGFIGRPYVLGAMVPKDEKNYKGPFDCAEFAAYGLFQTYGFLYGCSTSDEAKAHTADAYTGFFDRDAHKIGKIITVSEAAQIAGALILRVPSGSAIGHIVVSQGNGKTIEAHSTKTGCIESIVSGRRFDYGILPPGIEFSANSSVISSPPKDVVYKLKTPYMKDQFIKKVQEALGFKGSQADGVYGPVTQGAVVQYQRKNGLVMDGELTMTGETARTLFKSQLH
jgi:N-acetylmuramoyl-L-alanine amidase